MYLDELKKEIGDPLSDEGYARLSEEAEEQISSGYIVDQMDLVNYISQILTDSGKQLNIANPKRYDELQRYWVFLAFAAFQGYSPTDKDNLIQRRVLYAIQKGYDPQSLLDQFFSMYQSDEFIAENFRLYAHDLEQNTENFGTLPITVEGKRMLPQLKYWIIDYSKYPSKVAKRGAVERLNYVENSLNTKGFTQGQREILLAVLKLYDEFLNPTFPPRKQSEGFEDNYITEEQKPQNVTPEFSDQEMIADKLEDLRQRSGQDHLN